MSKKTLVLGASLKEIRYSNMAINKLVTNNHEVIAIGLKKGTVAGIEILTSKNDELQSLNVTDIHTVTLYLNSKRQEPYYEFIISLNPKRVIFNPGTENLDFMRLLDKNRIKYEVACNLVLLSTNQY